MADSWGASGQLRGEAQEVADLWYAAYKVADTCAEAFGGRLFECKWPIHKMQPTKWSIHREQVADSWGAAYEVVDS